MIPPTFHNPLIEQLVNAFFKPGKEREFLQKGLTMLPTTKEGLGYAEQLLALKKEALAKAQQDVRDQEEVVTLAKVIFALTDDEGEKLADWHGQ